MPGKVIMTLMDYSREKSTVQLYIPDLDATNVAGYTDETGPSALATILSAIDTISLCNRIQNNVVALQSGGSAVTPANAHAQREVGLRFFYQDTVTFKDYHFTIPGPDLSILAEQGTDEIDPENVTVALVISNLESVLVSEMGNPIEITHVRVVGRSN